MEGLDNNVITGGDTVTEWNKLAPENKDSEGVVDVQNAETVQNPEAERARSRRIGKKVLENIHYQDKEEAQRAYERARNNPEYKFSGEDSPAARRIDALLSEIEGRSGAENIELGKKSMERSIDDLTSGFSKLVSEKLTSQLTDWSDYFSDESCELPTWFKMWAWQGMTKLGGYNTSKKCYNKRSKETIQTFPPLDKEALGETRELLEEYYGDGQVDFSTMRGLDEESVKKCNFNNLYSYFVNKHIVPTPEYGEAINGGWKTYELGSEKEVARAANGTGWCIVSSSKAKEYLERSDGSFTFLHLQNPFTGENDYHACASIRMEDGKVAEISGRKSGSGQMLEDSLVETVEAKVLSMPGGEEYRQAFEDRKELIRLARKADELTKEELEFLYEVHRPMAKLEMHSVTNDHVVELRARYDIETAISKGVDRDDLIRAIIHGNKDESVNEENVLQNLDGLLRVGADHTEILSAMSPVCAMDNFDRLTKRNVDAEKIVERMGGAVVAGHLEKLFDSGVSAKLLLGTMDRPEIKDHIGTLLDHGADADEIKRKIWPEDIVNNADVFRAHKIEVNVDDELSGMSATEIMRSYGALKESGVNCSAEQVASKLDPERIWDAGYQMDVREFLGRSDVDPLEFANAVGPENMEYISHIVTGALNNNLKGNLKKARDGADEATQARIDALKAKIISLGGTPTDTWY